MAMMDKIFQPGDAVVRVISYTHSKTTSRIDTVAKAAPFGRLNVDGTTFHKNGKVAMSVSERIRFDVPLMWLEKPVKE